MKSVSNFVKVHEKLMHMNDYILCHKVEVLVVSLFSTPEEGVLLQDTFEKTAEKGSFVGLKVPNFYFAKTVRDFLFAVILIRNFCILHRLKYSS